MEFLVQVDVARVFELPAAEREDVITREKARGRELLADGVIRHFWTVVGKRANVGVWVADDAEQLHAILSALPIWPWADIEVTPLITHELAAEAA
ncbi:MULTISPECIES: muconolactone Delta-isomerase [Saccharopolyspora]|uniref:Muconolactone Delta-isomerase n=1 Tax=Saccharopolyspora gregorii TaxID=33914 RepID=A0ABP6RLA1_9PSEU|nr:MULTISPECIES: muconolactone Delta-isomerase family protein [Saccharopolyspora]MCA1187249.1 muconolactone Delta-isomerase family protein [Saccharopolyspora sp. 6T]MCA1193670.1 muconolactone Delta-isomerase family protein [Saccharopolyspora sp. 6V]MCA1227475.1 muconolactone Delta-isomerase family protein [Saccharopolyspora sp. 6M]MCA1282110.1 muconolactone Delta-isomerase family protein [Saccharopolyspora sp. 7B]